MSLPEADSYALGSARAWLVLGDASSALAELARISDSHRRHPEVLKVEWEARAKMGAWEAAFATAEELMKVLPSDAQGWILRAFAARRMHGGGLKKAEELLIPALERFPNNFLVPYNLACYAAQQGRVEDAWQLLQRAMQIGGHRTVMKMAKADPDLKPVWTRLKSGDDEQGQL